jgi:hypothetical protein
MLAEMAEASPGIFFHLYFELAPARRQRVTFFNKQGHVQNAPTHYAQIWGDAALGG